MKKRRIRLYEREGRYGKTVGRYDAGRRHWLLKKYFAQMAEAVVENLPLIDWTVPQKTEAFFAEEWKDFYIGQKIALGRCLKLFVDRGQLPLKVANPDKKGPRKYALVKPQVDKPALPMPEALRRFQMYHLSAITKPHSHRTLTR